MSDILIHHAYEKNLKNISLKLPKNKCIAVCGVSGSGKSTFAKDVLFNECQRQYLEAMGMEGIRKPKVEKIENASASIFIGPAPSANNIRSTVGTLTHLTTDLRLIFEKLHVRSCPFCHQMISSAECLEKTIKKGSDFHVLMQCPHCHQWMDKLTRSYFSANTHEGCCELCSGLGTVWEIDWKSVLDENKSINEGAIAFWQHKYGDYQKECFVHACQVYDIEIDLNLPLSQLSEKARTLLVEGTHSEKTKALFPNKPVPDSLKNGAFEGIKANLMRRLSENKGVTASLKNYFIQQVCPVCHGQRLNEYSRTCTVQNKTLPEITQKSLSEIQLWLEEIEHHLSLKEKALIQDYLLDLQTKLSRILKLGLGYLTLDRISSSLSAGEAQRLKLAAVLDSSMSGLIYILDEPTAGLHGADTKPLLEILQQLRDLGNTVLVIEHDPYILKHADMILELGSKGGDQGGFLTAFGTLEEVMHQPSFMTKDYLLPQSFQNQVRSFDQCIEIKEANCHNLHHVSVSIPKQMLVGISGVSGSGKSTLIFDVLEKQAHAQISGLEDFDQIVAIDQASLTRMKRSNIATYSSLYNEIRKLFAALPAAKEKGFNEKHFSFNTPLGRCETCEGLGVIESNLLFFENLEIECPTCHGHQFKEEILKILYKGKSISDVLKMSIEEAWLFFDDHKKLKQKLQLCMDVGLSYLKLGQTLTTLSNGEAQRLKLASHLMNGKGKNLYLIDEPTNGLHPKDIEHFMILLHSLVDHGHSVVVIEHNAQLLSQCDWLIDLGPKGGHEGGQIIFEGTPWDIMQKPNNATGKYLKEQYPV